MKVLITTGERKFYSNGVDLDWLSKQDRDISMAYLTTLQHLFSTILTLPVVTIAAINGHAFAGGAVLAFSHDFRVMQSEQGWISLPEIFLNISFPPGINEILKCKIGSPTCQRDSILFGKRFTAEEALNKQLVDRVCEKGAAVETAVKFGEELVAGKHYTRRILQILKEDLYRDAVHLLKERDLPRTLSKL